MALTKYGFESGNNGDTATPGNTGAGFITATGGTLTISTAWAHAGTRSMRGVATSTSGSVYGQWVIAAQTAFYAEMWLYLTGTASAEVGFFWYGTGSTRAISLNGTVERFLRVRDAAGASMVTSTVMPLNTPIKVKVFSTQNATTGTLRCAWSDTPPYATYNWDSGTLTGKNTGAAAYDTIRVGAKTSVSTTTWADIFIDDWGWEGGLAGFPINPPVIGGLEQSAYVFLDLSDTTVDVGPVDFSASPSTGVVDTATGLFLPAPTDGSTTTYTVTATDTGNGATDTASVDVATQTSGLETVVWTGAAWS
jgi:hypothetical protein